MRPRYKIINELINRFDFLIRFAYCRLGPISRLFKHLFFWKLYSSGSPRGLDDKFEKMFELISSHGVVLSGRTILEIGPGNSLINAYNLLAKGAKKVYLVDKFPRYLNTTRQKAYAQAELSYIKEKYAGRLNFLDENGTIRPGCFEFITGDLNSISGIKVDFVFSQGVLEHVKNVGACIKKSAQLLNDGGFAFHYINLIDHFNFNSPYLFLKYSDFIWNNFLTREGQSYTNRWRYADYVSLFRESGFQIVYQDIERIPIAGAKINRKFNNYQDLDVSMLYVILQKNPTSDYGKIK